MALIRGGEKGLTTRHWRVKNMAWRVNVKFHSPNWRVDFFTLRMHIWNFHDIKGQKSISFKNENSKILQLQGASPLTPLYKIAHS